MKTKLIILLAILTLGCIKDDNEVITEQYDCGCTEELFLIEAREELADIVELVPIRICDLYPYEVVTESYQDTPNNKLYSYDNDIKSVSKSQGCN